MYKIYNDENILIAISYRILEDSIIELLEENDYEVKFISTKEKAKW